MYNRGSPPTDRRPAASHTVQHSSQQVPPHRSYVRQRQHSEPFIPAIHPPPPPPRVEGPGSGVQRGSNSAGHSPQELPRTSPAIIPRGTASLSRRNRTRSRSFHCAVSRTYEKEGEGQHEPSTFHFSDCFQSQKAQDVLCDMWERQELCDVVLVTDEQEFHAHRVVLASGSPYFRAMFVAGMSESRQHRVELKNIPASILAQILCYLYKSQFEIPVELVPDAIPAADILCIESLKEACAAYLLRQLDVTNCLGLYVFADTHSCTALKEGALKVIQKHFCEVIVCDEFKQLSFGYLVSLVSLDCLSVPGEERVFEAIAAWVGHDMEKRKQHFKDLLKQVRLPLMSAEFLFDHVYKNSLIAADRDCCDMFVNSLQFKCLPERAGSLHLPQVMPRRPPTPALTTVAVFGGMGRSELYSSAEILVPPIGQWQGLPPMRLPRWGAAAASLESEVYVAGGSDSSSRLSSVERFDVRTMKWSPAPHLNVPRNGMGLAAHNGYLYAIGGFNGQTPLKTVERYSPVTGQWSRVADMNEQRYGVGVGVMNDLIYVIGGTDNADLNSAECFDTQQCTWSLIPPMKRRRKYSGVAVMGGRVYVFGGCDGSTIHTSVEVYDPVMDQWALAAPLLCPRSGMGVAVLHGFIYVIGGSNNGTPLSSVEQYDPLSNRWAVGPSMATARDRLSSCVLELSSVDILSTAAATSTLCNIHIRQYSS